jgi:hypothetical protein
MRLVVTATLALTACGGVRAVPAIGNDPPAATPRVSALPDGAYACEFVLHGGGIGPHHCEVSGGALVKTTGFEPFTGTISGSATRVRVDAVIGCHALSMKCHQPFALTLTPVVGEPGVWRGAVESKDGPGWWLHGQQFELGPLGAFGGASYGDRDIFED